MKQLCEISPCVNTNEDPPAQLKSQPVAEEETKQWHLSTYAYFFMLRSALFRDNVNF